MLKFESKRLYYYQFELKGSGSKDGKGVANKWPFRGSARNVPDKKLTLKRYQRNAF